MSERVDWIPVTAWSAWVAFQASSAFYEWWTKPRNVWNAEEHRNRVVKKLRASKYGKILRGEKINGWKSCKFDSISDSSSRPYYQLLLPLWPKEGVDDVPVDSSVLVVMERERSPNGNTELIYIIRRYSLVAPGLFDDIVQIFFDYARDRWWPMMQSYVNESIVAIGWQRDESKEIRIVLVNNNTKTYQLLEMTSPRRDADISAIFNCSDDDHLGVLFCVWLDDNTYHYHLVEYEISSSQSIRSPIAHQVASRRLDWRQGNWRLSSKIHDGLSFPGTFYVLRSDDTGDASVVSLDRHGFHDLGPAAEWIAKFKTSPVGQRMAVAKNSLKRLMPIGSSGAFELHRSHLFGRVDFTSHVHQPMSSPPSLMYLAAEALCMAKPNFDFDDLKSKIGFDIFDGICDGKEPIVIRM